jgi:WD40 repeat protein
VHTFRIILAWLILSMLEGACTRPGTGVPPPAILLTTGPETTLAQVRAILPVGTPATPGPFEATPPAPAAPGPALATPEPLHLKLSHVANGHSGPVTALAWSPDGRVLASSSGDFQANGPTDTTVRLWTADGRSLVTLTGHTARVYALAWSPDGTRLASGSADGAVRLWDAAGQVVKVLSASSDPVFALAWSPDGRLLAAGAIHFKPPATPGALATLPGIVHLWQADGTIVRTLSTQYTGGKFYNLAWSPDGKFLAGGAVDYRIWRPDGMLVGSTPGCPHCTPAWAMAWFPDSQKLALGDESGNVQIYDPTGQLLDETRQLRAEGVAGNGIIGDINQLAVSPDGKILAVGSLPLRLAPLSDMRGFIDLSASRVPLAWSPDGGVLATSAQDASVRLWRADGTLLEILDGCAGETRVLAWSPDGKTLAVGSAGQQVCLWRIPG